MKFTTRDQDNDSWSNYNCAISAHSGRMVDGGITVAHTYTLTISTTMNMQYISIISGMQYLYRDEDQTKKTAPNI